MTKIFEMYTKTDGKKNVTLDRVCVHEYRMCEKEIALCFCHVFAELIFIACHCTEVHTYDSILFSGYFAGYQCPI